MSVRITIDREKPSKARPAVFIRDDGTIQTWSLARDSRGWIATEPDGNRRIVGDNLTEAKICLGSRIAPNYAMRLVSIAGCDV